MRLLHTCFVVPKNWTHISIASLRTLSRAPRFALTPSRVSACSACADARPARPASGAPVARCERKSATTTKVIFVSRQSSSAPPSLLVGSEVSALFIASFNRSFRFRRWCARCILRQPRHVFLFASKHSLAQRCCLQLLHFLRCGSVSSGGIVTFKSSKTVSSATVSSDVHAGIGISSNFSMTTVGIAL